MGLYNSISNLAQNDYSSPCSLYNRFSFVSSLVGCGPASRRICTFIILNQVLCDTIELKRGTVLLSKTNLILFEVFSSSFSQLLQCCLLKTNYMYHSDLQIYEIIYERRKPDRHCSNFPILCTFVSPGYKDFKARESKLLLYLFERYDFKRF